jgi:cbb3-type cytochrome oxidase subunit 3
LNGNIPLSEIGKSARTLEKIGLPFGLLYPFFCFVLVEVFFFKKKKKRKRNKKET